MTLSALGEHKHKSLLFGSNELNVGDGGEWEWDTAMAVPNTTFSN